MSVKWAVVITAADGTMSVAGPFVNEVQASGWSARLELTSNGDLAGQAAPIENPAAVLEEVERRAS